MLGLVSLFAVPAASASSLVGARNTVGVIDVTGGQRVGLHDSVAPGQGRIRAPAYDSFVVVSCVAPEADGDTVLLGKSLGLQQTAEKIGARTLLSEEDWQGSVSKLIQDPNSNIAVSLDNLPGATPYAQVMNSVSVGLAGRGQPLDWELAQLYQAGRLPTVTFYSGGSAVENPFAP
jgi:hypothetical protein